ncbi:bifunctional chorismate synthase/riboflavin reductase [NAD(P)H] aro2 [Metarhizium acridum]|uniref:bifunctional chorismate synthase/riboflavin reductase [NAD(P)H] aro2 n=1 Tax=Metarhizium acridum TaxID=92637 RepID=UPI001C6CF4AF|nr:bifunctional chorismate synthase/riboflavin reductase [NAD(P)H] aro2 [Metarhizium acridum]
MSTFGKYFRVTTAGESHGKTVSCIIENCPPGLSLVESDIQPQLNRRRPGQSAITTPRDEKDRVTIGSGCEFGRTCDNPTGTHNVCHDANTLGSQTGHTHTPDRAQRGSTPSRLRLQDHRPLPASLPRRLDLP